MARTIVAMFDSRTEAEQAAEMLADAGFDRADFDIRSSETPTARTSQETSWWEWLFGESDDRAYYNEGLERGAAFLRVTADDRRLERAQTLLESRGAEIETEPAGETQAADPDLRQRGTGSEDVVAGREEVVPVVEERLKVGKRDVERGGVRVYSHMVERPVEEDIHLREERVHVERRPTDRPVTASDDVFRDRTVELTESAEEAVVAKEARVVEEVVVGKEIDERVERVRDTVRKTEVDVQNIGAGRGDELFRRHEPDFRQHWTSQGGESPDEECRSAYGYGCELGADARHAGDEWSAIEPEARRQWEQKNPGTWDRYKEPVRYSWDKVRQEHRRAA